MSEKARQPLKAAYLIVGDDLPKIELALKRLKARIVEQSGSDLNIDEFDATVDSAAQVVNAANTLAFLGGTRLVLVHEVQAWLKADKEVIAAYLKSPAPDACLTLVAEKIAADGPAAHRHEGARRGPRVPGAQGGTAASVAGAGGRRAAWAWTSASRRPA